MSACVLCIHSFGSNWRQYRGLAARLAPRLRVIAPDLYGHGETPAWQGKGHATLADEAAALEALLPKDAPVHLVGHSYGAAVALHIAAARRLRVRSMALYEPAIWGTLAQLCPGDAGTREIEAVRDDTLRLLQAGELAAASERFIDYWAGPGTWAATPEGRRPKLMQTVRLLQDGWHATFSERWTARALRSLHIPCLLLSGTHSTAAAQRALRILRDTLPDARVVELDGLGHMGPITHPPLVDAAIASFLAQDVEQVSKAA